MDAKDKNGPKEMGVIEACIKRLQVTTEKSSNISREIGIAIDHINRVCKRIVGVEPGKVGGNEAACSPQVEQSDDCPLISLIDNSTHSHEDFNNEVCDFLGIVRILLTTLDPTV